MKFNLKNKLSLAVIGVILFFGFLAVFLVFFQVENKLISESKSGLESVSRVQAHGLSVIFQRGKDLVKSIANDETIVEYMRIKNINSIIEKPIMFDCIGGQVEMSDGATLRRLIRYNIGEKYSAIYLIATDGTTWVSTDETFTGQNYAFRDYFQQAISGDPWVDVAIGVTSKKIGYYFSYPVKSHTGDIIGVAVVKMKPDLVDQFINSNNINDNEVTMFVDSDGVVIFSNDESRIYKSLGSITQEKLSLIKDKKRFSGIDIKPLGYDVIQEKLGTIGSYGIFDINDKIDKKREIVSVAKIEDLPFFLVIERDVGQFYGSSLNSAFLLSLIVFGLVTVSIIIIVFLVNRFLKPLQILKTGLSELAKENFDYKFTVKSKDELEELGESFNIMSDKLKITYSKLKEQIDKLKKINHLMVQRENKMIELKKQIKNNKEGSNLS